MTGTGGIVLLEPYPPARAAARDELLARGLTPAQAGEALARYGSGLFSPLARPEVEAGRIMERYVREDGR